MSRFRLLGQDLADNERVNIAAKKGEMPLNSRQRASASPVVAPQSATRQPRTAKPQVMRQKKAAPAVSSSGTLQGNCVVAAIFLGIYAIIVAMSSAFATDSYFFGDSPVIAYGIVASLLLLPPIFISLIYFVPLIRQNTRCPQLWALLFLILVLVFALPNSLLTTCYYRYGEWTCEIVKNGFLYFVLINFGFTFFPALLLFLGYIPPLQRRLAAQGKLPVFPSILLFVCTVIRAFPWGVFGLNSAYYAAIVFINVCVILVWFVPGIRNKVRQPFIWLFLFNLSHVLLFFCSFVSHGEYSFSSWPSLLMAFGPLVFFILFSIIPPIHRLVFQRKG